MRDLALVAAGGALGASARYLIGLAAGTRFAGSWPWHTFGINITGAFLLGLLMAFALGVGGAHSAWLLFLGTGVLGGFTTFSTFAYEATALAEKGALLTALTYLFGSAALGLAAAALGLWLGHVMQRGV